MKRSLLIIAGIALFLVSIAQSAMATSQASLCCTGPSSASSSGVVGTVDPINFTSSASSSNSSRDLAFSNVNPGQAYFEVPARWQTNSLNLSISNLRENRTWTSNIGFDNGTDGWNSSAIDYTDLPVEGGGNASCGWISDAPLAGNNCTVAALQGTYNSSDTYYWYGSGLEARWDQLITIPRGPVVSASVECDVYLQYAWVDPGFEIFFSLIQNGTGHENDLAQTDFRLLANQFGWTHLFFQVDPTKFDFSSNATIDFAYGLGYFRTGNQYLGLGPGDTDNSTNQTVYFDNVKLNLESLANPSDVNLSIVTLGMQYPVSDVNWGVGYTLWNTPFPREQAVNSTLNLFQFDTNWTDCRLDWNITANASTSAPVTWQPLDPYLGIGVNYQGMQYQVLLGQPVSWSFYIYAFVPVWWNNGFQIYLNITKDWNISSVINPQFIKIRNDIIGGSPGDGFFEIPAEKISSTGFWSIQATSPNYFNDHYFGEVGTFTPNAVLAVGSTIQLKLALAQGIDVPLNITGSLGTCNIFYPNGSLFWTASSTPNELGILTFPTLWIGAQNTTIGQYQAQVVWTNGTSVAANATTFVISHQTRLSIKLPAGYQDGVPIPALFSSSIAIRVELADLETGTLVAGVNLTLRFNNAVTAFSEITPGTYDITVDSSQLHAPGVYNCTIHASGAGIAMNDLVIQVNFYVPQTLTWVIVGFIVALTGIISVGVAWAKLVIPRRQRAYNNLLEVTSNYYDAHSLVGYLVLYKTNGLTIFDQWQDLADRNADANLISGFLTAIASFGEQIPVSRDIELLRNGKPAASEKVANKYRTLYMDYENFAIVLQEGEFTRVACIFTIRPSRFFEVRLQYFLQEFEDTYRAFLVDFSGALSPFQKCEGFFNKYVQFAMTRPVEINQSTKAKKLQKDIDLTSEEQRMMNVIQSFLREKDYVRLRTVVSLYGAATKDAEMSAVKGIVGLWFKNLLLPVDPEASIDTALRFFSEEDAEILAVMVGGVHHSNQIAQMTGLRREGVEAKLQSFRAWKLINLKDEVTPKGRTLIERRRAKSP